MAVPDAILRAGQAHPDDPDHAGALLSRLRNSEEDPFLNEAAEIVYAHQERLTARLPARPERRADSLGARMFSVADTLDAITSDRPYRPAQFAAARAEIDRWKGRQFDPEVVKVFLEMDEKIWPDLRKEVDGQVQRFAYSSTAAKNSS
jgi:response regulator RpfG family c-di-GMP phosphodiesterase